MTCLINKNVIHLCPFTFYSLDVSATLNISSEKWHFLSLDVSIDSIYVKWNLTRYILQLHQRFIWNSYFKFGDQGDLHCRLGRLSGSETTDTEISCHYRFGTKMIYIPAKTPKLLICMVLSIQYRVYLQKAGINRVYDLCSIVLQRAKIYFISKNSKAIQFQC